jgi:PAS domain S-box-containing protein
MLDANIQTPQWLSQMERILEELNEGVAIADDQLRVIFVNESLARLGQYDRADLQGRTPDAIFPAADLPVVMRQHESDLRYGHHRFEFYLPRKDGQKVPVIFSGRVIKGPDGRRYHLVIVTDITSQKCIEQQLRETNALLKDQQLQIEADLALASRVQQSLAPRGLVWNDLCVETYYSPARAIGGDFGIVVPQSHDVLNVIVCDVTGNGIGPALLANRIHSEVLHELERTSSPGSLLRHIHEFAYTQIATDGCYLTMAAGRFTHRGRRLAFASGGHPPAMHVSNRGLRLLESQNGILGCLPEIAPSESAEDIELDCGDRLVLYTDGLVEVFNAAHEMFGVEGLANLVLQTADLPLSQVRQAIVGGVSAWRHGPLADDVSLVIVEVR